MDMLDKVFLNNCLLFSFIFFGFFSLVTIDLFFGSKKNPTHNNIFTTYILFIFTFASGIIFAVSGVIELVIKFS